MHRFVRGTFGEKLSGGVKIMRRQNTYPAVGADGQKLEKQDFREKLTVLQIVAQCRKTTHSTQHYLNTLPKTYPTLMHLSAPITYLNTWGSSTPLAVLFACILVQFFFKIVAQCRKYPIPYLNTLNRTVPYLNTLSRTVSYLNTLSRTLS